MTDRKKVEQEIKEKHMEIYNTIRKETTVGDAVIDWLNHESVTKAEKPK